jgi:hypothetical protein
LRYVVLHADRLSLSELRSWGNAGASGLLQLVHEDAKLRIYRVADVDGSGEWTGALASNARRALTLTGLPRDALALGAEGGSLEVALPGETPAFTNTRSLLAVRATIENRSEQDWAGLDVQREGLVELRYRFSPSSGEGEKVVEATAPLDIDIPAAERRVARAYLKPPRDPGEYLLEVELVQRLGAGARSWEEGMR